jgi:glycosyltransferase involved in cell wall biosynthesis
MLSKTNGHDGPSHVAPPGSDLICFSHLRWHFVYQRPQHLLSRCARERRVLFFEEPVYDAPGGARLDITRDDCGVTIAVPHLAPDDGPNDSPRAVLAQRALLDRAIASEGLAPGVLWYYTPMALAFSAHLTAPVVVYDCMDELTGFTGAPAGLRRAEQALMRRATVMFTGGQSLYEAKRDLHPNVHAFPSSVDVAHFARARSGAADPQDQAGIPHPRLGFYGVIDERFDVDLIRGAAERRPDWQFVMIGPIVKIDPATLPRAANVHYLGPKPYDALPEYLSGWDVALLPFARNAATRFISPTKTPEYLAAGCPVVSTSIRDVVRPYGELGLARIADDPDAFVAAVDAALEEDRDARCRVADALLGRMSWDLTWQAMSARLCTAGKDTTPCSTISLSVQASQVPSSPSGWPPAEGARS